MNVSKCDENWPSSDGFFLSCPNTRCLHDHNDSRIKEEFDLILLGLQKRGLDLHSELEDILAQDDIRKRTKKELDDTLHEARILSKEIGGLFKAEKKKRRNKPSPGHLHSKRKKKSFIRNSQRQRKH